MAELIKIDRNGTKYFQGMIKCDRCGGKGIYYIGVMNGELLPAYPDNGTCYKCGGSGTVFGKWVERTPEYEAKLAERRAKKAQARQAELDAEQERIRKEREEEERRKAEEEERIRAEKARSKYIGEIGEKLSCEVTFEKTAWFDFRSGWLEQRMFIHTFKDDSGNALVWKTTSNSLYNCESGKRYILTGTVKDHSEYDEQKQTVLTRCKIREA